MSDPVPIPCEEKLKAIAGAFLQKRRTLKRVLKENKLLQAKVYLLERRIRYLIEDLDQYTGK